MAVKIRKIAFVITHAKKLPDSFCVYNTSQTFISKFLPQKFALLRKTSCLCKRDNNDMGVTFDETEKKFVFDFEHDGAEDIGLSIQRPVDSVHKKIDLYHYDIVVMPQNRTKINQYMVRYIYRFNQPRLYSVEDILSKPMDEKKCSMIRQHNVLVIDDVTAGGSRLNEVLRTLRILNEDNEITIFSLIGRKELTADSM